MSNQKEVGIATPSQKVKSLHTSRINNRSLKGISLKAFVRQLIKEGGENAQVAELWMLNKTRKGQTPRSKANADLAKTIKMVVKQGRNAKK